MYFKYSLSLDIIYINNGHDNIATKISHYLNVSYEKFGRKIGCVQINGELRGTAEENPAPYIYLRN